MVTVKKPIFPLTMMNNYVASPMPLTHTSSL